MFSLQKKIVQRKDNNDDHRDYSVYVVGIEYTVVYEMMIVMLMVGACPETTYLTWLLVERV